MNVKAKVSKNSMLHMRPTRLVRLAAVLSFATMALQAQAGTILQEVATASHQIVDPAFGSTFSVPLTVDRFDTLGGTRQLLGVTAEYFVGDDYTATVSDNTTTNDVAANAGWEVLWTGSFQGNRIFPDPTGPNTLLGGGDAFGFFLSASQPGGVIPSPGGGFLSQELITDASLLSIFTGSTPLEFDSNFSLSDLVFSDDNPFLPPHVFAPELLDIAVDALNLNLTLTYNYVAVPAPASLCLLGFGALPIARRRRRN